MTAEIFLLNSGFYINGIRKHAVCMDGTCLSIQDHRFCHATPGTCEVCCMPEPLLADYDDGPYGDDEPGAPRIYGCVPLDAIEDVVAAHDGILDSCSDGWLREWE